jgi:membrane protease YdiL (CAAX protease family)
VIYGLALAGVAKLPTLVVKDLTPVIAVKGALPENWMRAGGVVAFAAIEEVVWRGAVTRAFEASQGSRRAPWIASLLFVVAVVPSMHPSLIVAAIALGVVAAFVFQRTGRLLPTIIAHAMFTWLAVELVLPVVWDRIP